MIGSFAIANLFHATILGIGTGCILAGFASLLMRRDYNGVRIFGIWLRLCSLWISANRMGGLTANHFPGRRRRRFKTPAYRGIGRPMRIDVGKFDFEPDDFLPLVAHRSPNVVMLLDGSYKATIRVPGFGGHDLHGWDERNTRRRQTNTLVQNIADDNMTMTVHLVRHHTVPPFVEGPFRSEFAERLNRRYRASIAGQAMTTEWLVSLIVSPRFTPLKPLNRLKQRLGWRQRDIPARAVEDSIQALEDRVYILMSYLRQAGARRLGLRTDPDTGVQYSEIAEADRLILTGEWSPVPNLSGSLGAAVYNQRAVCGRRGIEIAAFGGPRFGMILGLKQYMNQTRTGMLDELLYANFPFVLSQAFHFKSRAAAATALWLREIRMENAMEKAKSQIAGLVDAADDVASGREVRGDHHFSLAVYGDTFEQMLTRSGEAAKIIGNMGAVPAMEDRGSFAAYWSQLDGNPDWLRTRPGDIGSRNFSAFASFDGVPTGSRKGWWGEALIRFVTAHGTVYDFCLHIHDVGHTMVLGRTGRGKTALLTFLAIALEKAMVGGGTTVYFDKDRGAEPMVRACGGPLPAIPARRIERLRAPGGAGRHAREPRLPRVLARQPDRARRSRPDHPR